MHLEKRIIAFSRLGEILRAAETDPEAWLLKTASERYKFTDTSGFSLSIRQTAIRNGWFSEENIFFSIYSIGEMLREEKIRAWIRKYPDANKEESPVRKIGVIMAGNIPMVGFHDFLCILMSGNIFMGKLSSEDEVLLPALAELLIALEPEFKPLISFHKTPINSADIYIATGSNNSARYFEYYFAKHPHIIRKNRNSIAILTGEETPAELTKLGKDIFQYFGMGCRNVSKIYFPENYNTDAFFSAIVDFGDVINHNKYYNNYQYYRTIYLLNREQFLDNNFLLLKESTAIPSPIATLNYERYNDLKELYRTLKKQEENIQCIVSNIKFTASSLQSIRLGQTQSPELWDYADNVDTMKFLFALE